MSDKCFVDTNILMYAHDTAAGEKHERARAVVEARGDQLVSVPVTTGVGFSAGTSTVLFAGRFDTSAYDVSPDGTRFLILQPPDAGPPQFTVVTNWFAEVARLVSGRTK